MADLELKVIDKLEKEFFLGTVGDGANKRTGILE